MEATVYSTKGLFYLLQPDMRGGRGHGLELENGGAIPMARHLSLKPDGCGLSALRETPRLRYSKDKGDMPNDLERGFRGYWLVSSELRHVFEAAAPAAFMFAGCDLILENGSLDQSYSLCEVASTVDAIDEERSVVRILTEGYPSGKHYSIAGGASLSFKTEAVDGVHVFRTPYASDAYCDRFFRDSLIDSGFGKSPHTRGVRLIDASSL